MTSSVSSIKRAQKESLLFRQISQLVTQTALDDARLKDVFVNRVQLSPDKGLCTIYFYTSQGEAHFEELMNILILYKPSLRKALSSAISSRYVPELIFRFDKQFEKQQRIEQLIEQVRTEGTTEDADE